DEREPRDPDLERLHERRGLFALDRRGRRSGHDDRAARGLVGKLDLARRELVTQVVDLVLGSVTLDAKVVVVRLRLGAARALVIEALARVVALGARLVDVRLELRD